MTVLPPIISDKFIGIKPKTTGYLPFSRRNLTVLICVTVLEEVDNHIDPDNDASYGISK
jgi:hypothetical protein